MIEHPNRLKNIGDSFDIKYNRNAPEQSTDILVLSKAYIWSGTIWGGLGLGLMILSIALVKKNEKSKTINEDRKSP